MNFERILGFLILVIIFFFITTYREFIVNCSEGKQKCTDIPNSILCQISGQEPAFRRPTPAREMIASPSNSSEKTIIDVREIQHKKWFKIYFLKTHKTASSTIENIMMRLALNYNKTIARNVEKNIFSLYLVFINYNTKSMIFQ